MNAKKFVRSKGTRGTAAALFTALASLASGELVHGQTTQRQAVLTRSGTDGPFKLEIVDAPVKQPGANEVLVRVRAASLNRRDVAVLQGQYPTVPRKTLVPLSDGAGEVAAVGTGVTRFKVGDRVASIFFQSWIDGRPSPDVPNSALGGALDGMLSQYVTLNENGLVAVPEHLSFEEAATLPCAAVTAWNGLVTRGGMQSGDRVLLLGTGGVSVFGLQFAVAAGARPIITSSSDEKLARAKALGAAGTINYRKNPDWEKQVRELTNGLGVHHVLEVGGQNTMPHTLASLAPGAHIALIGGLGGFGAQVPAAALMVGNVTMSGIYVGSRENFEAMNAFISKHGLKPVVDRVFPLEDAQAAYDYMEAESHFGKIVIRP